MAVVHAPETEYAKEMRKWNSQYSEFGPPGRPWGSKDGPGGEFPKRLYKATRQPDGARTFEGFTVGDEHEQRNMLSRGFCDGQQSALDALAAEERIHAELAAEINHDARHGMGERARGEVERAQEAHGARHLPEVPVTPIRKRGRPVKAAADPAIR